MIGAWSAPNPDLERASQYHLGAEWRPRASTRVQVTVTTARMRISCAVPGQRHGLSGTRSCVGAQRHDSPIGLDGFARGVRSSTQRRSPNGLSGWLSYAYGRNRYHDSVSDETFWGDLDQRHTFNVYAGYRLTPKHELLGQAAHREQLARARLLRRRRQRTFFVDRRTQRGAPARVRATRSSGQPDVQLVAPPADALRRGHQRARSRERELQPAVDRHPHAARRADSTSR